MNTYKTVGFRLLLVVGLLLALAVPLTAATEDYSGSSGSYGYVRVVEGSASLAQEGSDERASAEINQPVMAGDHLWVPDRSHVEIVLADRNILRVDGGSELILERLAGSPDRDDQATVIRLLEGNLQLAVTQDSLGDELPRIDTANATLYVQNYGMFRITAEREGWSQVVVRRGTAEVVIDGDRQTVRADEEAVIEDAANNGDRQASIDVHEAGGYDALERWARRLDDEASSYQQAYVDDNLRYQASSLNRYGSWIDVEGSRYWRPVVSAGWRPYWQGRWVYTRAGLTWVSSEPWGWVPYHYGTWDYLPAYGWVWQPGYVWSPAWVYWYWGPSYVGWCPTGFYTSFYGSRFGANFGFRHGVYGWAGGSWGDFGHWNFINAGYFRDGYRNGRRDGYWDGRRDVQRYAVRIDGEAHGRALERGIITTDTKPLRPSTWQSEGTVLNALNVRPIGKEPPRNGREAVGVGGRDLPDVTTFVARKPQLPTEVVRTVATQAPGAALDGTPLKPSTLGRGPSGRDREAGAAQGRGGQTWTRPGEATGGRPSRVEIGGDNPRRPADNNGRPGTWERPGRPTTGADGGAPRPERSAKPDRSDRSDSPGSTWSRPSRPAPEADGGSPRPRTGSDEKPARPERPAPAPETRERSRDQERPRQEKPREVAPPPPERERSQPWRSVDRPQQDESVRPEPAERYSRPSREDRPSNDRPAYQPRVMPPPQERERRVEPSRPEPRPERASPPPQRERPAQEARPASPPPQNERSRGENTRPPRESKPREKPPADGR
ncbi:MAG: hypothetical protein QOF89_2268 [Acidobacteriota bacterium]|jgi:hypothetical protein|nr:hypothetical protein [Acidobacteriota bacterium]